MRRMTDIIKGICSMATRQVLAELVALYAQSTGITVTFESVGGVDAALRVQAGEAFDVAVLGADALDKLIASGRVLGRVNLVHSGVAVAVRVGSVRPDISTEEAVRQAVLAAPSISYSTGPSGVALGKLFERWGIGDVIKSRIVVPPPGMPVGTLLARGEVALGFQQLSELMNVPGITLLGGMPPGLEIITSFVGAVGARSARPEAVRALLDFMSADDTSALKRQHGMDAATAPGTWPMNSAKIMAG